MPRFPPFWENKRRGALPSSPYGIGFFFIPPIGANVWIEFEAGNLDYPIWSGCFWDRGGAPTVNAVPQTKMIKTDSATITLDDLPDDGRITIESNSGLKIVMDVSGITLTNCAGLAPIRLDPTNISGAPTSGNHMMGELSVHNAGILYYCSKDGTPGTWKKVQLL